MSDTHSTVTGLSASQVERFWSLFDRLDNGCWLWTGGTIKCGGEFRYGAIRFNGKQWYAHRLSWSLHNELPIPRGMHVRHSCDVPLCGNPLHLNIGTAEDNRNDCSARGRMPNGDNHVNSIIRGRDVPEIRRRFDSAETPTSIAPDFGVSPSTIRQIGKRWTWLHVPEADGSEPIQCLKGSRHGYVKRVTVDVPIFALPSHPEIVLTAKQITRFWSKVDKSGSGGCWLWTASLTGGRGQTGFGYRRFSSHQVAWMLTTGNAVPSGLFLCHSCDVGRCCNPDHLTLGTPADNSKDCQRKGRTAKGELSGVAVLTTEIVREIRRLHSGGMSTRKVAASLSLSHSTVANVIYGRSWKHVL